jgi:hypothetical protein
VLAAWWQYRAPGGALLGCSILCPVAPCMVAVSCACWASFSRGACIECLIDFQENSDALEFLLVSTRNSIQTPLEEVAQGGTLPVDTFLCLVAPARWQRCASLRWANMLWCHCRCCYGKLGEYTWKVILSILLFFSCWTSRCYNYRASITTISIWPFQASGPSRGPRVVSSHSDCTLPHPNRMDMDPFATDFPFLNFCPSFYSNHFKPIQTTSSHILRRHNLL